MLFFSKSTYEFDEIDEGGYRYTDKVLYPAKSYEEYGVPEDILNAFISAKKTYLFDDSICALSLRRVIELICKNKNAIGNNLAEMVKDLITKNIFPPTFDISLKYIREIGNEGAHEYRLSVSKFELHTLLGIVNDILEAKNTELADAAEKLTATETIKNELQQQLAANKEIVENLDTWETRFDAASLEQKKGILLNIIDKILVFPHGIRTDYKIETRGFGTLQAIDRPDWLAEPTSEIALAQISENSKIEPNTAPYYNNSGVNHTPQAIQ